MPTALLVPPSAAHQDVLDAVLRARLRAQQQQTVDPLFSDPEGLLRQYGRILSAVPGAGDIPFEMWDHLPRMLQVWSEHRLTIVLKSRQIGISWLLAAYALCVAREQYGANVLMLSMGEDEAADLLDKARFIESRLPPRFRARKGRDNRSELEFPESRSRIVALPATKDAGRGQTATLVVLDEYASHAYAEESFLSIKPTIDAGGRMLVVSTAKGYGGAFADLWDAAGGMAITKSEGAFWEPKDKMPGPNGYYPVFVDWTADPRRDQAWYDAKKSETPPGKMAQEYPSNPEEAFIKSGRPVFDYDVVKSFDPVAPRRGYLHTYAS